MRLFNAIAVETGSKCTRKCWFCPVAYNPRPTEWMSLDMIGSIAQQLNGLKYKGRIELYMYNEPFLDDRIYQIISIFRTQVPGSCIMLATNGDMIKETWQFQEAFDVGLNQMQINVYSNMPRYSALEKMLKDTTAVASKNVWQKVSAKKQLYSLEIKFDKRITPTSKNVGKFELSNRSGLIPSLPVPEHPVQKLCVRPFRSLQINWKGQAVLCCNDNTAQVVCGDLKDNTVKEIWEDSPVYKKYRISLLQNNRKGLPLCEPCSFTKSAYPHMVRKFWGELIT